SWISAAAAAGSLSAGIASAAAPAFTPSVDAPAHTAPCTSCTERERVVGIGAEVQRLVSRYGEIERASIVAPRPLRELGVDDVALADVVLGLETRFDVDIDADEASTWVTVGDVVGSVAKKVREARSTQSRAA
ncbi:MAG TPA: acyl carrier protein, partial [Polyangiaceae bacterium]